MAHVHSATRPAKPAEYAGLYQELKGIYERPKFEGDPVSKAPDHQAAFLEAHEGNA